MFIEGEVNRWTGEWALETGANQVKGV